MNSYFSKLLLILLPITLVACGGDDDDPTPQSVYDVAKADGSFTILVDALDDTGLSETLDDLNATFTVFAPNDDAFNALDADTLAAVTSDADLLSDILLYHVVAETEIDSATAEGAAGTQLTMANEDNTVVSLTDTALYINLAQVISPDVMADNGVIHVLDSVLIPPADPGMPGMNIVETAMADGRFETLVAAATAADLVTTLSNPDASLTVFAPTDDAFAALGAGTIEALLADTEALTAILLKHVIDGEVDLLTALTLNGMQAETLGGMVDIAIVSNMLTVGGANVIIENLYTSNGIIHVIDAVIAEESDLPPLSIINVAQNAGSFSILLQALEAANLTETVGDLMAEFTVFAPTDDAFTALLADLEIEAADLLADPNLGDILLYHVLAGSVNAEAATALAGQTVETAGGSEIGISLNSGILNINTSAVATPDVMAANGIIHVIDQVLLPPSPTEFDGTIAELVSGNDDFSILLAAVGEAGLAGALADDTATFTVFAPTDEAFNALLAALEIDAAGLLASDILLPTLQLHVIPGLAVNAVTAASLSGTMVATLGEAMVEILVTEGELTFGGSTITTADIVTDNGIVHVIDTVITQ